jgi:hypothetical protein
MSEIEQTLVDLFSQLYSLKKFQARQDHICNFIHPFLNSLDWDKFCKLNWNIVPIYSLCLYLHESFNAVSSQNNETDLNSIWCSILLSLQPKEENSRVLEAPDSQGWTLLRRCMNTKFTSRPIQLLVNRHRIICSPFLPGDPHQNKKSALFDCFQRWLDTRFSKHVRSDAAIKAMCLLQCMQARDCTLQLLQYELFFPNLVKNEETNAMLLLTQHFQVAIEEQHILEFLVFYMPHLFVNLEPIVFSAPPGLERPSYASIAKL